MSRFRGAIILAIGLTAGAAAGYRYANAPASFPDLVSAMQPAAPSGDRKIVYYRDPSGEPYWSAEPKQDAQRRDYLPVYEDEEVSFDPAPKKSPVTTEGPRRIRYYRNPMGLPDTSPVPKKDPMGMVYIPVYEGEDQDDGKTVKVSLDKIQRSGVRTESVHERLMSGPVVS